MRNEQRIVTKHQPFSKDFDRQLQALLDPEEDGAGAVLARTKGLEELKQLEKTLLILARTVKYQVLSESLMEMIWEYRKRVRLLRQVLNGKFDKYEYIDLYGEAEYRKLLAKRALWLSELVKEYQIEPSIQG